MSTDELTVGAELESLQRGTFSYFLHETAPDWPASLPPQVSPWPVAVDRASSRGRQVDIIVAALRFLWNSEQGPEPAAAGRHGSYYHFLDVTEDATV